MDTQNTYLNIADVKAVSGMGETFIRQQINDGKLKAFRLGRSLRLRQEDVQAWMESSPAA